MLVLQSCRLPKERSVPGNKRLGITLIPSGGLWTFGGQRVKCNSFSERRAVLWALQVSAALSGSMLMRAIMTPRNTYTGHLYISGGWVKNKSLAFSLRRLWFTRPTYNIWLFESQLQCAAQWLECDNWIVLLIQHFGKWVCCLSEAGEWCQFCLWWSLAFASNAFSSICEQICAKLMTFFSAVFHVCAYKQIGMHAKLRWWT